MSSITPLKKCTKCNTEYPATAEFFHIQKDKKDGLNPQCKQCKREYRIRHYAQNREKERQYYRDNSEWIRLQQKEYYQNNRDEIQAQHKEYYSNHQEEFSVRSKRWREENKDRKREMDRAWAEENKDRVRERSARRRLDPNYREYQRVWSKINREKILTQVRKRREENPELFRERRRNYYIRNADRYKFHANQRIHRKRANGGSFTKAEIDALYESQNGLCFYCWCDLSNGYVKDHWIPVDKGGDNWIDNIRLSCASCNLSKSNKMPYEWGGRFPS